MQLIENDRTQGDTEGSLAHAPEVTSFSSSSEALTPTRARRVVQKVPFSHPLAHLDPQLSFIKKQFESRRQTRSSATKELMAGFTHEPSTRQQTAEVLFLLSLSLLSFFTLIYLFFSQVSPSSSG